MSFLSHNMVSRLQKETVPTSATLDFFENPFQDYCSVHEDYTWAALYDPALFESTIEYDRSSLSPEIKSPNSTSENVACVPSAHFDYDLTMSTQQSPEFRAGTISTTSVDTYFVSHGLQSQSIFTADTDSSVSQPSPTETVTDKATPTSEDAQSHGQKGPRQIYRQERRKEQNRASQRRFRASKEAKIMEAQHKIRTLEEQLHYMTERNYTLEREWSKMRLEVERLAKAG